MEKLSGNGAYHKGSPPSTTNSWPYGIVFITLGCLPGNRGSINSRSAKKVLDIALRIIYIDIVARERENQMNAFMNALYNAIGAEVTGYHNDKPFHGKITYTRVKFGNDISVHVEDDNNIYVIDGSTLYEGENATYKNLHVYFN